MNHITAATASALNKLIDVNRDGFFAYQEAEQHIKSVELQGYFNLVGQERLRFGQELFLELFKTDCELVTSGLNTAERPLPWRIIKGRFIGQSDQLILRELDRLETWALNRYDKALKADLALELQLLLERQVAEWHRVHRHLQAHRVELLPPNQSVVERAMATPNTPSLSF